MSWKPGAPGPQVLDAARLRVESAWDELTNATSDGASSADMIMRHGRPSERKSAAAFRAAFLAARAAFNEAQSRG